MSGIVRKLLEGCANVGTANAMAYLWKAMVLNGLGGRYDTTNGYRTGNLSTRQLPHPIRCRYGSTDFKVFNQIFFQNEYGPLSVPAEARLILDCGAYVGYSTMYFLARYPNAHVIAVEADSRNYALLKQNLTRYETRVTIVNAGLWSHRTSLKIRKGVRGEWSTNVHECLDGEQPDLEATDIPSLLAGREGQRIDLLKMDIEGAERVVFGNHFGSWIDLVDTFVIELHGDACEAAFLGALGTGKFGLSNSGELKIAHRKGN